MTDKLQERIRKVQDEHAGEQLQSHLELHKQIDRDRALLLLGGFKTASRIAHAINSEVMRSLEMFQQERIYEAFGYERFVDFLDNCEHSPMSKTQYYERKALLDKEGDQMFNIYSELGISIRKRKLLGKGNVEIDGENAIIRDEEGAETIVPINDTARLMEVVTAVIDSKITLQHKFDRQKETIESQKVTIQNRDEDYDKLKAAKISEVAGNPHMIARVELGLAFTRLAEAAAKLSAIEKDQFRDGVLQDVAEWRLALASGYATDTSKASAPVTIVGDSLDDALENFLDNVDLDDVADNNDGELAAAL